MQVDIHTH